MTNSNYLRSVLAAQDFDPKGDELNALRAMRGEVESILRTAFGGSNPTIKYAGSYAKNTMIRRSYDLDIVCYFPREADSAGQTLADIYENVAVALQQHYFVHRKTSALRIEEQVGNERRYTHIDVVPGRFLDDTKADAFLYQYGAEKCRLLTNTKTHILHIRDSGLTPSVRLVKLWRETSGDFKFKTFVLELLVVELLKDAKHLSLDQQVQLFWELVRDRVDSLNVQDPANTNNSLSEYIEQNKQTLVLAADIALRTLNSSGWEGIYGSIPDPVNTASLIATLPSRRPTAAKPWGHR